MRREISLTSSTLDPEDNCMYSAHDWVFVVKLGGMRGGSFVLTNMSLMNFTADTLKASHYSTKMEFMWKGKIDVIPYFSIHVDFTSL